MTMTIGFLARVGVHHIGSSAGQPMAALAALRAPPFLPATLFETHITWWLAALAVGAVILFVGRRGIDRRLFLAGQIVLGVSLLWILAAVFFDTAGERLYKVHQTLAAATEKGEVATIISYLEPSFTADGGALGTVPVSRANASEVLGEIVRDYTPRAIHITAYRIEWLPYGTAVTHITVIANLNNVGPTKSRWHIRWADVPGADWRIEGIGTDGPPADSGSVP